MTDPEPRAARPQSSPSAAIASRSCAAIAPWRRRISCTSHSRREVGLGRGERDVQLLEQRELLRVLRARGGRLLLRLLLAPLPLARGRRILELVAHVRARVHLARPAEGLQKLGDIGRGPGERAAWVRGCARSGSD